MGVWLDNGEPCVGTLYPPERDAVELGEKAASDLIATVVYGPISDEDYREAVEEYRAQLTDDEDPDPTQEAESVDPERRRCDHAVSNPDCEHYS